MNKHRTTLVFDEPLWLSIRRIVADRGVTVSEWVAEVVRQSIQRRERPGKPWRLNWHTARLGGHTREYTTRDRMYELFSD